MPDPVDKEGSFYKIALIANKGDLRVVTREGYYAADVGMQDRSAIELNLTRDRGLERRRQAILQCSPVFCRGRRHNSQARAQGMRR